MLQTFIDYSKPRRKYQYKESMFIRTIFRPYLQAAWMICCSSLQRGAVITRFNQHVFGPVNQTTAKYCHYPYHLVATSMLPILFSILLSLNLGYLVCTFFHSSLVMPLRIGLLFMLITVINVWFFSILEEEYAGYHTIRVQQSLKLGIVLFIVSEIMLFVSFFWAFFHSSLNPSIHVGFSWPMVGVLFISWNLLPLVNTIFLLSSGISVSVAHSSMVDINKYLERLSFSNFVYAIGNCHSGLFTRIFHRFLMFKRWVDPRIFLLDTVLRGVVFLICQYIEYYFATFSITDGIYGSTFFMATGLHGLHVIIGVTALYYCFLYVSGKRWAVTHYKVCSVHSIGLDGSIWYWHFVDVVWLYLFLVIYWWASI